MAGVNLELLRREMAFPERLGLQTRGNVLDKGTVVYVQNGHVGEAKATDGVPRVLTIAGPGEVAGYKPDRSLIVVSPGTKVKKLTPASLELPIFSKLKEAGNQRSERHMEGLLTRDGTQLVAFALHELSTDEEPIVTVYPKFLGLWIGMKGTTVSTHYKLLKENNAIEWPMRNGAVRVVNRAILTKLMGHTEPLQ